MQLTFEKNKLGAVRLDEKKFVTKQEENKDPPDGITATWSSKGCLRKLI